MNILIAIGHPARIHLFKNLIWEMEKRGHKIKIIARDKEVALYLLSCYGFDYKVISTKGNGVVGLGREMLIREYRSLKIVRKFKTDLLIAGLDPSIAHVGKLLRIPAIIFTDSGQATEIADLLTIPFSNTVLTLTSVRKSYGKREIRVNSYKELAYLHPNWFKQNESVLNHAGVSKNEDYALLRFVSWGAYHDVARKGIELKLKQKIIRMLIDHGITPYISSEGRLATEFTKYAIPIPPEKLHDFLYYAKVFIGDSQTMTTEAACLGVPAIRCNSFVGENDMGNFIELEQKYGLIFNYNDADNAVEKVIELIQKPNLKEEWQNKREKLLKDKIDVTSFMVWFIENYPESFREMKENPEIQYKFK